MIGFLALPLLLVLQLGSLPLTGFLMLVTILLLGTGACALELYRQVRPGHRPPESEITGSDLSAGTPLVSAS